MTDSEQQLQISGSILVCNPSLTGWERSCKQESLSSHPGPGIVANQNTELGWTKRERSTELGVSAGGGEVQTPGCCQSDSSWGFPDVQGPKTEGCMMPEEASSLDRLAP